MPASRREFLCGLTALGAASLFPMERTEPALILFNEAACQYADPDLFFPVSSTPTLIPSKPGWRTSAWSIAIYARSPRSCKPCVSAPPKLRQASGFRVSSTTTPSSRTAGCSSAGAGAPRSVSEGAAGIVWAATLPDGGPVILAGALVCAPKQGPIFSVKFGGKGTLDAKS